MDRRTNPFGLWAAFSGALGLALLFGVGRCGREWRPQFLNGLALRWLLSIGVTKSACGGGGSGAGNGGTPPDTYSPVVTGTFTAGAATLTHNVKVTLVVQ